MKSIAISVHFHEGRYHGEGDWPPCPARLFQALVAAAGLSGKLGDVRSALTWLEELQAPLICAPLARRGQRVMYYMPNNDLDIVGGDLRRIAEIRTAKKFFHPWCFDSKIPFLYVWQGLLDADIDKARAICIITDDLFQLGRGIDMAWAVGEILDEERCEILLTGYHGQVYWPVGGLAGKTLLCPEKGLLCSLEKRYRMSQERFEMQRRGKTVQFTFRQAPRANFQPVSYDSPSARHVYDLRMPTAEVAFAQWPLVQANKLVTILRDSVVERLKKGLPDKAVEIDRVLVGRKPDGTNAGPTGQRVKIIPLPSIGHPHADRIIRRVLVETPAGGPIRDGDVHWAFSGLEPVNPDAGENDSVILTPATDEGMLRHYGLGQDDTARVWRTVTPIALPEAVARRRIEPARKIVEAKGGVERTEEQHRAIGAVIQALRHAAIRASVAAIRVQREPFDRNGERVEAFAIGTRFSKERLWHVEIIFGMPISGPLVIGDGRFAGLGVMAPVWKAEGIYAFEVETGLVGEPDPTELARALRRAVMARVQFVLGRAPLSTFFTGHEHDGSLAQSERQSHLSFAFESRARRLLVLSPHIRDRREATNEESKHLGVLESALRDFQELRAGSFGRLGLRSSFIDFAHDSLFSASRTWESLTPYVVTRHAKNVSASEALSLDIRTECRRRGFPEPIVTPRDLRGIPGVGLVGAARLSFQVAVDGPLLLGKTRHFGGGLFTGVPS